MAVRVKRATIYLEADLHKALRLKSVETSYSVSRLVNGAVRESIFVGSNSFGHFLEDEPRTTKRLKLGGHWAHEEERQKP